MDPIRYAGRDVNLYGFVANSPTNRIDLTGLQKEKQSSLLDALIASAQGGVGAVIDRVYYPKPEDLDWGFFAVYEKQKPPDYIPGRAAQTIYHLEIGAVKPIVSVQAISKCGPYIASVVVKEIKIRVRFVFENSWYYEVPFGGLSKVQKEALFEHERGHFALAYNFTRIAAQRWNDYIGKDKGGVTGIGVGMTPGEAIAMAHAHAQGKLQAHLKIIEDELNRAQKQYEDAAHRPGLVTTDSQRIAEGLIKDLEGRVGPAMLRINSILR